MCGFCSYLNPLSVMFSSLCHLTRLFFSFHLHLLHPPVLLPDSLQHVLGEYGLVRPMSVDAEGRFLSHAVSAEHMAEGQPRRRLRREVQAGNDEWEGPNDPEEDQESTARREKLYYNVTVFGREFHLRLRHNARLVAPGAKIEWHDDSDSIRHTEALRDECLFVGDVTDTPGTTVAISNCDGLVSGQQTPC